MSHKLVKSFVRICVSDLLGAEYSYWLGFPWIIVQRYLQRRLIFNLLLAIAR